MEFLPGGELENLFLSIGELTEAAVRYVENSRIYLQSIFTEL